MNLPEEETGQIAGATFLRNKNILEAQMKLFCNIRYMEGKIKGGSTSKVTITAIDGSIQETITKESVEVVSA